MSQRKQESLGMQPTRAAAPSWDKRAFAAAVIVAAAVCLADGSVVRNGWVSWDDHQTLYENPDFNPPQGASFLRLWREPRGHLYIPITYSYWWGLAAATWQADGLDPLVFHAASLALHIIAAWLVMGIALRLTGSVPAACAGALIFAMHPVQVEAVAWASGAKDLLSGVLSLAAVWLVLMRHSATTSSARSLWIALGTFAYMLAVFAKPSAVVVPLVVVAIEWLAERRFTRGTAYLAACWLLLALPIVMLTRSIQGAAGVFVPPIWQRPIAALDAIGFYLQQLVWPARLAFVYGRTPDVQLAAPWTNVFIALVAAIAIALTARRWPVVAGAAAIFLAGLLPYLGLVPFDFQAHSTVADHYLYLAMLGPALAAAYFMKSRSAVRWSFYTAILVLLAIGSYQQTQVWRGPLTLLRHAVAVSPARSAPHAALGIELARRNDLENAEQEFRTALSISPKDSETQTNLAHLLSRQGRYGEALEHYRLALDAAPHDTLKMNNLAIALAGLGRTEESIGVLRAALAETDATNDDLLHGNLGKLLLSQGHLAEARAEFERALALNPELEIAKRGVEQLKRFKE